MTKSTFFKVGVSILSMAALLLFSTITTFAKHASIPNALYVVTSKDTPSAATFLPGKIDTDVFHFDLYSRPHEGAIVKKIDLQILGTVNSSTDLFNFKLYDENSKELVGTSVISQNGHVVFSNLSVILANKKPKKFSLHVVGQF